MRRISLKIFALLLATFPIDCQAGIADDASLIAKILNQIKTNLDKWEKVHTYSQTAIASMQLGKRPPAPDPALPFGTKLSDMLDKTLTDVQQISAPADIIDTSEAPDLTGLADLAFKDQYPKVRKFIRYVVKSNEAIGQIYPTIKVLDDVQQRCKLAYDGATEMADGFWTVSSKVPQAYMDIAGMAAVDIETVYKKKLSDILSEVTSKHDGITKKLTDAVKRHRADVFQASKLLETEAEFLREAIKKWDGYIEYWTNSDLEILAKVTKYWGQMAELDSRAKKIRKEWSSLSEEWKKAQDAWEAEDTTQYHMLGGWKAYDDAMARYHALEKNKEDRGKELVKFADDNKQLLKNIEAKLKEIKDAEASLQEYSKNKIKPAYDRAKKVRDRLDQMVSKNEADKVLVREIRHNI